MKARLRLSKEVKKEVNRLDGTVQVGIAQVGTVQVGIAQVVIAQVGTAQVEIAQDGAGS